MIDWFNKLPPAKQLRYLRLFMWGSFIGVLLHVGIYSWLYTSADAGKVGLVFLCVLTPPLMLIDRYAWPLHPDGELWQPQGMAGMGGIIVILWITVNIQLALT